MSYIYFLYLLWYLESGWFHAVNIIKTRSWAKLVIFCSTPTAKIHWICILISKYYQTITKILGTYLFCRSYQWYLMLAHRQPAWQALWWPFLRQSSFGCAYQVSCWYVCHPPDLCQSKVEQIRKNQWNREIIWTWLNLK